MEGTPAQNPNQDQTEKLQEFTIVLTDRIRAVSKLWWYAAIAVVILCIPLYYVLRNVFTTADIASHTFPAYIYQDEAKLPLQVVDTKVFKLADGSYGGYMRIRNSQNLDWGAAEQPYTAVFYTTGGTEVTRITSKTFVLPASEKILVFPRFSTDREPAILKVTLGDTQFIRKPDNKPEPTLSVERVSLEVSDGKLVVSGSIKNNTPFTIKEVGLPVLLYDSAGSVVGANYTNINDVAYGESRSFQLAWPNNPQAVRAEVLPEVDIFDPGVYELPPGQSEF
ncbi:MAG TPA: FxLYD domain-containing protein [Patescibacteria group bacterium]|nr:FxLYD domain-containing protein [Patescibacteria group bacterium]